MGDTKVKVSLWRERGPGGDRVWPDVSARRQPEDLTYVFVARDEAPLPAARLFQAVLERSGSYVFTVASEGRLDLEKVYLVKCHVEGRP